MCIIIDTNKINNFLTDRFAPDAKPIDKWISSKKGFMVYSASGKLGEELGFAKTRLRDYSREGRAILINSSLIESEQKKLKKADKHRSNDVHILALAKASGARLLYTADVALMDDFKNGEIINNPRGKIYSGARHKNLLRQNICSARPVT